jgi:hypothetical protein
MLSENYSRFLYIKECLSHDLLSLKECISHSLLSLTYNSECALKISAELASQIAYHKKMHCSACCFKIATDEDPNQPLH